MKERLLAKFDELLATRIETNNNNEPKDTRSFEHYRWDGKNRAALETLIKFYEMFVTAIPEDQREAAHEALAGFYTEVVGEQKMNSWRQAAKAHAKYATPEEIRLFLLQPRMCPEDVFRVGSVRRMIEAFASRIDPQTLEKIVDDINAYQPDVLNNRKVYPLRGRVEMLKVANETRVSDPERRKALNAELDSIADLVITSTVAYSDYAGEIFDATARKLIYIKGDEINDRQLEQDEYKHLTKYFRKDRPSGGFDGDREITEEHENDTEIVDVFMGDDLKMVIPKDRQDALMRIVEYMKTNGMLFIDGSAGEAGDKVYAFKGLYEADKRLSEVIETDNLEEIRAAKENYIAELGKMRELYALVRKELNPNEGMMLGNVNSFRTPWLPNELKNDVLCNAFINGIFNLNINLAQNGISYEQFFENPGKATVRIIKNSAKHLEPNNILDHDDLANAIKTMAEGKTGNFSTLGIGRNFELAYALTNGTPEYEKNALSTMLITSYVCHVTRSFHGERSCTMRVYLKERAEETLANVFLVNPEDRDYGKLRAVDSISIDYTEKTPPFNSIEYLSSHKVDPSALIDRINKTISDLSKMNVKGVYDQKKMMLMAIDGAQMAAYKYLLVNPVPVNAFVDDDKLNDNEKLEKANALEKYEILKTMAEDPLRAFGDFIMPDVKDALSMHQSPLSGALMKGDALIAARTEARNAERAYAMRTADLKKQLQMLDKQRKSAKGKSGEIENSYKEKERELKKLTRDETKRLDKAFEDGQIPRYYYEQRKADVEKGNPENNVPFGGDECIAAARAEARKAEQAYAKKTATLRKNLDRLSKKLAKGDEKIKVEYERVAAELDEMKSVELDRLDKAYADGKLTKSYYEQRKADVESGNLKNTVPFGEDDCPTFDKFKERYKNELKLNELDETDVRFFYDRMLEDIRFEDAKFKLTATGNHPNPAAYEVSGFDLKNTTYDHPIDKTPLVIPEVMEKDNGPKSPEIVAPEAKHIEKEMTN